MKKIDMHCHVTAKNLRADLIDLTDKAQEHNIEHIFLMSTYFPSKGNGVSNYRLYSNIKSDNLFKMYISLDFNYFWMAYNEMLEILQDDRDKVAGIKIYTGYQDIDLNSNEMGILMQLAIDYNLPVIFHTGYVKGGGRATSYHVKDLELFFAAYKNINFVIAHLGNPETMKTADIINSSDNVYADISGLMEDSKHFRNKDRELFMTFFNMVDTKKILYGTDYPVQTHSQTNKLLKYLNTKDKKKIMYKNSKKLFIKDNK